MDAFKETILSYKRRPFLLIEPGGNNGDVLIYKGMEKKLKQLGIKYVVLRYQERFKIPLLQRLYFGVCKRILVGLSAVNKSNIYWNMAIRKLDEWTHERLLKAYKISVDPDHVFLVHGGGNINDFYHFGIRLLKNILQFNSQNVVIVGPQTYWFFETPFRKLFSKSGQEIFLFCRERPSYRLLDSLNLPGNVRVLLCHDTALYLSKQDFGLRKGHHTLVCLRTDQASAIYQGSKRVQEILESTAFGRSEGKVVFEDLSLNVDFEDFVGLIETAHRVYTDRLHVAILAAILGKETTLYSNLYFKNKAVYEYSLSNFSNVKFVSFPLSLEDPAKTVIYSYQFGHRKTDGREVGESLDN